jgi:cephalosporin hydroxylase
VTRPFDTPFPEEVLIPLHRGVMGYTYKGHRCFKCPLDLAIYMKLLWDLKPRTIIEIGSKFGGSALFFADMAQIFGLDAHVYSIDLDPPEMEEPRITFLRGDVHHLDRVFAEHRLADCPRPWFVTEDSAHSFSGCRAALDFLAGQMRPGEILAMEDGNLDDLGWSERYDGGPNRAIAEFLEQRPGVFEVDTALCDTFGRNATFNPNGYLRRT